MSPGRTGDQQSGGGARADRGLGQGGHDHAAQSSTAVRRVGANRVGDRVHTGQPGHALRRDLTGSIGDDGTKHRAVAGGLPPVGSLGPAGGLPAQLDAHEGFGLSEHLQPAAFEQRASEVGSAGRHGEPGGPLIARDPVGQASKADGIVVEREVLPIPAGQIERGDERGVDLSGGGQTTTGHPAGQPATDHHGQRSNLDHRKNVAATSDVARAGYSFSRTDRMLPAGSLNHAISGPRPR